MEQKERVTYPLGDVRNRPVINIAGRDYVVLPYQSLDPLPDAVFEADKRHPEREEVKRQLETFANRLINDVVNYLRDALAVTVTRSEEDDFEDATFYRCFLPVLMPLDTKDRWAGDPAEIETRIMQANYQRRQNGKPYSFKQADAE